MKIQYAKGLLALAAVAALAGCQQVGSRNVQPVQVAVATPPPAAPSNANAALNGQWVPTDAAQRGLYVAEFRNGVFVSRAPNSADALAKGRYSVQDNNRVSLNFVGAVSKREVDAQCEQRSPTTLYCVPTVGSPFNLSRA